MKGRNRFNDDELGWIREQLIALRAAEREEAKRIRAGLRRAGFHISDWPTGHRGFEVDDFDSLLASGSIVRDDTVGGLPLLSAEPDPTDVNVAGGPLDSWVPRHFGEAIAALAAPRHQVAAALAGAVPDMPGLYALYGGPGVWRELCLGEPLDDRPLYVGKAQDSLVTRDLGTHFATGRTGSSSPRRSLAALLAGRLPLVAMPRRPEAPEPDKWTHFALEPEGDEQLTDWMRRRLQLAVWSCPRPLALADLERAVMRRWRPPLNLTGVDQPWRQQVKESRAVLAADAEAWARKRRLLG